MGFIIFIKKMILEINRIYACTWSKFYLAR